MILLGKLSINGKHFTMTDSDGTVYLKELKLPDNWYAGYVKELRKTKYGIYLCLNRQKEVVNLAYTEDGLTEEGKELLFGKVEVKEAETDITQLERSELLALAKKLKIEGKIATMKTADLIAAIQGKQE